MNHNIKEYSISLICVLIAFLVSLASSQNGVSYNNYPISIICMALSFIIHWLVFIPSYFYKTEKFYDITGTVAYLSILLTTAYLINLVNDEGILLRSIISIIFVMIWAIRLGIFLFKRVIKVGEDKRFEHAKKSFSKFLMFFNISALCVFLSIVNVLTMIINIFDNFYIHRLSFCNLKSKGISTSYRINDF